MTVGTAKQLTAVWDSWVAQGIKEDPLGSNRTPIGEEFGWNGVAWCCESASVAQTRVGLHCFHEAAVVEAVAKAKRGDNGMVWLPANAVIREGDHPCFQWADGSHHIAYCRDPGTQVKFQTNAGNEHDRMYQQWRDRKYVMGFIRLPYGTDQISPPEQPQEDDEMPKGYVYSIEGHPERGEYVTDGMTTRTLSPAALIDGRNRGWYVDANPKEMHADEHNWLVSNTQGHNVPDPA